MKNFRKSDYALNKNNKGGIAYRFADGTAATVTLADYLAENPGKTEADFRELKRVSDEIYEEQDRAESRQTRRNVSMNALRNTLQYADKSAEDTFFDGMDMREEDGSARLRLEEARKALGALTEAQRRRYLMYRVEGLTICEIAELEGASFQMISKTISAAQRKIKNRKK